MLKKPEMPIGKR